MITTRNIEPDQVQVTVEDSGTGLDPNTSCRGFLTLLHDEIPAAWAWDSRSAVPSFRIMAAGYGLRPTTGQGASFHFTLPKYKGEEQSARVAAV